MTAGVIDDEWEETRLRALHELSILDTEPEPEFDDLISLAAAICGVPISLISFMDSDRQWFKAAKGTNLRQTLRSTAFCDHTIRQTEMLLVEDARNDSRFSHNPFVAVEHGWRFYAGLPLRNENGLPVGTLCVLDYEPKALTSEQRSALRILADQVCARLELRARRRAMEALLEENQKAHAESQALQHRFESFMDSGPFLSYMKDPEGRMLYCNRPLAERFRVSRDYVLGKLDAELWPESADVFHAHDTYVLQSGSQTVSLERTRNEDGSDTVWQSYKFPCRGKSGESLLGGVSIDVTEQLQKQRSSFASSRSLRKRTGCWRTLPLRTHSRASHRAAYSTIASVSAFASRAKRSSPSAC